MWHIQTHRLTCWLNCRIHTQTPLTVCYWLTGQISIWARSHTIQLNNFKWFSPIVTNNFHYDRFSHIVHIYSHYLPCISWLQCFSVANSSIFHARESLNAPLRRTFKTRSCAMQPSCANTTITVWIKSPLGLRLSSFKLIFIHSRDK